MHKASKRIAYDGVTRARLRTMDSQGKTIELVEESCLEVYGVLYSLQGSSGKQVGTFALPGPTSYGLSRRRGEKNAPIQISNERNSLQFTANIFVVNRWRTRIENKLQE